MRPHHGNSMPPYWDFQDTGRGVDHADGPPFPSFEGGFPFRPAGRHGFHHPPPPPPPYGDDFEWGAWSRGNDRNPWAYHPRRGPHGRRHRRRENEGEPSGDDDWISASETERDVDNDKVATPDAMPIDDAPEDTPEDDLNPPCRRGGRRFGGRGGRGGRGGGRRGMFGHGPFHDAEFSGDFPDSPRFRHHGHHGRGFHGHGFFGSPFDFNGPMRGFGRHPRFRGGKHARRLCEANPGNDAETFTPPVDIFDTKTAFILHVSLPGAKKEDVNVKWDTDRNLLNISGAVQRPGDEEFLKTLASSERTVGTFNRDLILPPDGSDRRDEVDGSGISAKMENGVLVISVPKVEREWTEVRKVDIE